MIFTLPDLPYKHTELEPYISADTLSFHHGKHHATYINNLNKLITGTDYEQITSLEEIIKKSFHEKNAGIFNNAAQVWNHTFYWHSMTPGGGGQPNQTIQDKINESFGSFDNFCDEFKQAGATQFGSGWAWLVLDQGKLKVTKTANADTPLVHGQTALMTCDVWEHAYYLDYQNKRPDYIATFLTHLVNWQFVADNLGS